MQLLLWALLPARVTQGGPAWGRKCSRPPGPSGSLLPRRHSECLSDLDFCPQRLSLLKPASQNRADVLERKEGRGSHDEQGAPVSLVRLKEAGGFSVSLKTPSPMSAENGGLGHGSSHPTSPPGKVGLAGVVNRRGSDDPPPPNAESVVPTSCCLWALSLGVSHHFW